MASWAAVELAGFSLEVDRATRKRTVPVHLYCLCCLEPCAHLWDPTYPVSIA